MRHLCLAVPASALFLTLACGGEPETSGTTSGSAGTTATTGGIASTGGSTATGGSTSTATGGNAPATGGTATTGGQPATGGAAPTGGTESGGASTTSGGTDPGPDPTPTSGCDAATFPESGTYTMEIQGTTREYIVSVPQGYDGSDPTRLVFVYHGLTGTAEMTAGNGRFGYFGIQSVSDNQAILVAPQGLASTPDGTDYAWRNDNGEDSEFARAMMERLSSEYCIDAERIFVTGMSYGGIASNTIGCDVGDVVRAIAPIAGAGPGFGQFGGGGPSCMGQVAALLIHGTSDDTVAFSNGEASRDHWREANGCSDQSTVVENQACADYEGCECVLYSGCQDGYPVEFCSHPDGHIIPNFSAQTIWDFFMQF